MVETLTVWNPFADELLDHWLGTREADGRVGIRLSDEWRDQSRDLLLRHASLALQHPLSRRHLRPKENLAILLASLHQAVSAGKLDPRQRGRLQHSVDSMIAKRGAPGSSELGRLRAQQISDASRPRHHDLAHILAARLNGLDADSGIPSAVDVTGPVTAGEAIAWPVSTGTPLPAGLVHRVAQAAEGTVEELVATGTIPASEELARLVPHIAAESMALAYSDPPLQALVAATYTAFRSRRSLLLVNLEGQVRFDELPWIRALAKHRHDGGEEQAWARAALTRITALALTTWPGSVLPNRLVRELDTLSRQAGMGLPLTEELAADIFMGAFSIKFQQAAQLAGGALEGSLYVRYYGIDVAEIQALPEPARHPRGGYEAASAFATVCHRRAGVERGTWSVASNGAVVEQSQVLTTHNLAALVSALAVQPESGWRDPARTALATTRWLLGRIPGNRRPLRVLKNSAYAWRQAIFFLSLMPPAESLDLIEQSRSNVERRHGASDLAFASLLLGLEITHRQTGSATPFYGWVHSGDHPLLDAIRKHERSH